MHSDVEIVNNAQREQADQGLSMEKACSPTTLCILIAVITKHVPERVERSGALSGQDSLSNSTVDFYYCFSGYPWK